MRSILAAFCVILAAALPCPAQGDKPKPNTLTPKEIADGWILLFDGETTFGWKTEGAVKATEGMLVLGEKGGMVVTTGRWVDYEFAFDFLQEGQGTFRPGWKSEKRSSLQNMKIGGGWANMVVTVQSTQERESYSYSFLGVGGGGSGSSNSGRGPFEGWGASRVVIAIEGESKVTLRNIKLRPLETKSIFNGKDLTGWKAFPGDKYKSKFTVTDKAPSTSRMAPAICRPSASIRTSSFNSNANRTASISTAASSSAAGTTNTRTAMNARSAISSRRKPTQKYMIEEFDPMTNKLLGKKESMSTAVDYGTGAIYRRQPARKEMAKDGEWFGMTIVAHGNHLATWVNGVQVADFTDNRPKSDNARTGCKLDAGHISIQGHDPTTDLSFRNIRIAEFK